jgi:hypothetical protein
VLGDLNDFEFSNTIQVLKGGLMTDLMDTLPLVERYSYDFEGNSQTLDQIVVSNALVGRPFTYDVVHVNSEFADQASDHDPQVARFDVEVPTATPTATASPTETAAVTATATTTATATASPTLTASPTQSATPTPSTTPTAVARDTPTSSPTATTTSSATATTRPSSTPTVTPTATPSRPLTKDDCKDGGWQRYSSPRFKNQGDCVSYVATGGRNPGAG